MRSAKAKALPERHSSIPYLVVKELGELFALIVKATLAKVGQIVKQPFKKFGRGGLI